MEGETNRLKVTSNIFGTQEFAFLFSVRLIFSLSFQRLFIYILVAIKSTWKIKIVKGKNCLECFSNTFVAYTQVNFVTFYTINNIIVANDFALWSVDVSIKKNILKRFGVSVFSFCDFHCVGGRSRIQLDDRIGGDLGERIKLV